MSDTHGNGARDQYRLLFEGSADANLIIDGESFVDCNDATVRMLRYESKEALLQTHPSELSPETQPDGRSSFEKANELMSIAIERGSHRFEWWHKRADGEVFPVEVLLTAIPGPEGTRLHTVWRELTERKRLEEELRQAQKMEAIGRLTGGIAHDFNNLLVAIIGHAELMEMVLDESSELAPHVQQIRKAGDRAAELVAQLLAFSRKQAKRPAPLDLNELLRGLDPIFTRLLGENIKIEIALPDSALPVLADAGQMEQVIVNLATNARDAMPDGGVLVFSAGEHLQTECPGPEEPGLPAGRYACLAVSDTGTGIQPAVVGKIFEPFFTTKPQGRGTGLGLATVYGVVKQNQGEVTVATVPGAGTTFKVYWPLLERMEIPDREAARSAENSPRGTETILVVEDEPAVARLIVTVLESRGYTTFQADNGKSALALIAEFDLEFDLLLTDVVMPEMGGPELVTCLRRDRPELRFLLATGYTNSNLSQFGDLMGGLNLIHKPFRSHELLTRVRRILDA